MCLCAYASVYLFLHDRPSVCFCASVFLQFDCLFVLMSMRLHVFVSVYVCVCLFVYLCLCVCVFVYMCMSVCLCVCVCLFVCSCVSEGSSYVCVCDVCVHL